MERCERELLNEQAWVGETSAAAWAWYARSLKTGVIACVHERGYWAIVVDGVEMSVHRSFPLALHSAYVTCRALQALGQS
jgi:hypothetical protein